MTLSAKYTLDTVFTLTSALVSTSQTAQFRGFDIIYKVAMTLSLRPRRFEHRWHRHVPLEVPPKADMDLGMLTLFSSSLLKLFLPRGPLDLVSGETQSREFIEHT